MREIKFRGKRLDNGEWMEGNYVAYKEDDGEDAHCIVSRERNMTDASLDFTPVDPATVGQFTGLLDKNGKEIYEGDVVRYIGNGCGHYFNSEVSYKGAGFDPIAFMYESGAISDMEENDQDLHIIGNIHDSPELLK